MLEGSVGSVALDSAVLLARELVRSNNALCRTHDAVRRQQGKAKAAANLAAASLSAVQHPASHAPLALAAETQKSGSAAVAKARTASSSQSEVERVSTIGSVCQVRVLPLSLTGSHCGRDWMCAACARV